MNDIAIKVDNVTKLYKLYDNQVDRLKESLGWSKKVRHKEHYALKNVSFEVNRGETVGIIGTNGSGKSTLLKIITGVLNPTEGNIEVQGKISALLELGAGFNPEYTGIENIYLNGTMAGYSKERIASKIEEIVNFADIGEFINQPVKSYSSGMFARLAFAVAINIEPDILIVDEALSVGDVFFQNKCFRKFDELREKGTTILFVSHDIGSVRQMCSRVLWIERGNARMFADKEEVCACYIDEQRMKMNEGKNIVTAEDDSHLLKESRVQDQHKVYQYPKIMPREERFKSDELEILSCFITNENKEITQQLNVTEKYTTHVVVKFNEDVPSVIIGFVMENNKGIPMFDINNYIAKQKVFNGKKGTVVEIAYDYHLPKIMKGEYVVSTAIASGTQENHIMKTWLHGVMNVQVNNPGFNSSWIEIDSEIKLYDISKHELQLL